MNLKDLVTSYVTAEGSESVVSLNELCQNSEFRKEVVKAVVDRVQNKPTCVLLPSFRQGPENNVGRLTNDLALSLVVKNLVTGSVANLKRSVSRVKNVLLIKQSFRDGKGLKKQIEDIRAMGCDVTVLCLVAHSKAKLESFAKECEVNIDALVCLDEITK